MVTQYCSVWYMDNIHVRVYIIHGLVTLKSFISYVRMSDEVLCVEDDIYYLFINTIEVTKASGPAGLSGYMLKDTAEAITPILTHLFKLRPSKGFSDKYAQVPITLNILQSFTIQM